MVIVKLPTVEENVKVVVLVPVAHTKPNVKLVSELICKKHYCSWHCTYHLFVVNASKCSATYFVIDISLTYEAIFIICLINHIS